MLLYSTFVTTPPPTGFSALQPPYNILPTYLSTYPTIATTTVTMGHNIANRVAVVLGKATGASTATLV